MSVTSCLLSHFGAKSPIAAYKREMQEDVAELVADGMTTEAAWLQVTEAKLTELKAERSRIEQVVADAYVKTAAGAPPLETKTESADTETASPKADNAARKLDQSGSPTLAGAPTDAVQGTASQRPARAGAEDGGRNDGDGVAQPDGAGLQLSGGLGVGQGAESVSARGTGSKPRSPAKRRVQGDGGVQSGFGFVEDAGGTGGLIPANPAPNAAAPTPPAFAAEDFTIEDDLGLGEGGQKAKYQGNVAAIRLLRQLEDEGRLATPSEQRILAKYVGWGGLAPAFDENNVKWAGEFAELKGLLSDEDYDAAARSTRYAHYTSREIIQDGLYAALRHMGFRGGRMLEAGAGVGNFIGLMPTDMRTESRFTAIEREPFSAAIARNLYPRQIVKQEDFTRFVGNDDYYDAAVGNPPFASDPQTDASGRKHLSGLSLHNYFFAKAVDMLREGGILAQVVTNGFLDAKGDTARRYISDRTKLLGAIRLPNNAFSANANTEVTTDLIFLQKLPEAEWGNKATRLDAERWLNTGVHTDAEGREVALNQYFIDNPQMMLGKFGAYGTMYRGESPALVANPGQDTAALLRNAVQRLPSAVYTDRAIANTDAMSEDLVQALANPTVQEGGYYTRDGQLWQRIKDIAGESRERQVTENTKWSEKKLLGATGVKRITALAELRSTLRALLAAELASDKAMDGLRAQLNRQYDAYTKDFGLINDTGTMRVFDDDPDFPLLSSLEHGYTPGMGQDAAKKQGIKAFASKATKAPIFERRVIDERKPVKAVKTPADALAVSMAERGRLDSAYIGELLGRNPDEVLGELAEGTKPLLFMDPATNEYVLRDAYLSGNVREKLTQANQAGLFTNVRALEEVQPADVGAHEITARIGSPWVPERIYEDFAKELFGPGTRATVRYVAINGSFTVSIQPENGTAATSTWGTPSYHGDEIIASLLNNRPIRVTYKDGDGNLQTDKEATDRANDKAQELRDRFSDWLFADADRAELAGRAYNDTNNNYVTREFDGSWMTFPGKVPDAIIKFRRHQRNAIARIVQDRTALLDHVVGAGKTYTIVSAAMELKRTGLAKKPLIVVPNHLVKQWASDFYRLYPGANILTATKEDFKRINRRKFLAKIATGDWDAVIMAHSSYGFIKPAPEFESRFNGQQIDKILATIKQVEDDKGDDKAKKRTVKQLQGLKERLENRIKSLRDKPIDAMLDFAEIGVDQLFVDEAHLFKNLMFSTKMQNIAGLGDSKGSQRAYDMFVKANQLYEQNGRGQGVVFATGTPVSNTLAEMFHMMRYLMPAQMDAMGFESFDAWANTYAQVEQLWKPKPSGEGYKQKTVMSRFANTKQLLQMFDQVSDTVTMEDIKAAFRDENPGKEFPLPKVKGGERQPVPLRKSKAQEAYMAQLVARAGAIEQRKGPPQKGQDNILVVMTDGRKAAMDMRLVDPTLTEREPGGRIDRAAQEVIERYKKFDHVKGTQLIFSDLGTPLKTVKKEMAEYAALQARIEAGEGDEITTAANLGDEAALAKIADAEDAQNELDEKGADWLGAMQAAERGFSVYDDLKAALVERGIPEHEIAFIHDYNTDDQKAALFRKVNAGQIRVLMGSTAKLGAGTNVQQRLVALHHLDVPWKPSDVEQREGRIIRQGNELGREPTTEFPNPLHVPGFEVEILAYVTKDTLDKNMWDVQETKLRMINDLRMRKVDNDIENPFEAMELSASAMQAAATGNLDLLREIQLRTEVKKLEQKKRSFDGQKSDLQNRMKATEAELATLPKSIDKMRGAAAASNAYKAQLAKRTFSATIDGKEYTDATEAGKHLKAMVDAHHYAQGKGATKQTISDAEYNAIADADERTKWRYESEPLSVEFNGDTYTSRTKLGEAFAEFRGDATPISWEFGGTEYRSRGKLADALRQDAADSLAEQSVKQIGSIGPFAVTIEGQRNSWGDFVEVLLEADGSELSANVGAKGDAEKMAAAIVTAADNMANGAQSQLDYVQHRLARAKKAKAELEATPQAGDWPDMAKLEKAREEHRKILRRLASAGQAVAAPEPGSTIETLGGDMQATGMAENESDILFDATGLDRRYAEPDTSAYEPAGNADTEAVQQLAASLNRDQPRSNWVVLDAVAPRAGSTGARGRGLAATATTAKRLFGTRVVFTKFPQGADLFNGAADDAQPGIVFINVNSQRPMMAVLGHELLHKMRAEAPDIYREFVRRISRVIKNYPEYAAKIEAAYAKHGLLPPPNVPEELHGDIVGDFFDEPQFWRDMAADQPALFKRVAQAILKFLDNVAESLRGVRSFGTERYLTDISAARAAVVSAMRDFSQRRVAQGENASEGIRLSVAAEKPDAWLYRFWGSRTWPSEADARDMIRRRMVEDNERYAGAFKPSDPALADGLAFVSAPKGQVKLKQPKQPPAPFARIGEPADSDGSDRPRVDWTSSDLNDDGTADSVLQAYGRGKGNVYRAWVDPGLIPAPKGGGIVGGYPDMDGDYDWSELARGRGEPPPLKLRVGANGKLVLMDGNHRLAWWREQGHSEVPAYVIDERKGSDDVQFSIADTLGSIDQAKVRNAFADMVGNAGAKVSWWDKHLGTQYAKAEKFPAYKRVFERVQSYIEDVSTLANEAADQAPLILPKLETWKDLRKSFQQFGLKKADAEAVAAPIFQGTLTDQKVYSDEELRDDFGLKPEQIKAYRQFRNAVDASLDQVAAADVLRLLGDKNQALRELALADRDAMRDGIDAYLSKQIEASKGQEKADLVQLRKDIREKYERVNKLKDEGYAPLMRFGQYKVYVSDPETGESLFFGLYESKGEANRMARDLAEDPQFAGKSIEQGVLSQEQYKLFNSVPVESLEMFADAIGAEKSEVFQAYLRLAKNNRSALKRLIHRKGTAGFSEDVPRVLASFITSNSRLASGAMNLTAAKDMIEDIRDGDVKDEAIQLVESVQNPKETAAAARSLMFMNFIGGSIASAAVNLTQPLTMTLPYLSQFGGIGKATARLMAAAKMAATGKVDDPELQAALKKAEDDGTVSPQEIHHLTAQAMGSWGNNAVSKRAAFIWGAPFSLAEQFNRRTSFIAAYKTAQAEGIADPFAFAEKAVTETQGLYNKGNMPNLSRGALGATAMQFKQFSIHYLEWIKRMWNAGEPGSDQRRAGRRAVLIALALLMAAAGTDGLPFAEDIDDLIDTIGQALGYNTNSKKARRDLIANTLGLGDETADAVARGLSALPGVPMDVSLRMGMGNLLPGTGLFLRSNTDRSRDLLEFAGPAGGMAKQYMDAAQKGLGGDVGGALAGMAPVAIQNAMKAMDMWQTGEARDSMGRKVMEADEVDGLMKFLGFNPATIARESQKMGMIRRSEQLAKNVEGEIAGKWARAFADGDAEGVRDARQELADWNERNPTERISISSAQILQRVKKLRQSRAQRFITSASPERRRSVEEALQ